MKSEKMLAVVIVLQAMILISQWAGQPSASTAHAQITNPSERQLAILEESRTTNAKLERMISFLQSGDLHVKMSKEDDKK
jgi:hypothetical protein